MVVERLALAQALVPSLPRLRSLSRLRAWSSSLSPCSMGFFGLFGGRDDTEDAGAPMAHPSNYHIEFQGVWKRLGGRDILKGLGLGIRKGENFVIIGQSGTGKSVTLKHMVGLMRPDSGRVLVNGLDISQLRRVQRYEVMRHFGYLFQSGALLNWMSIEENVALPLKELTNLPDSEIARIVHEKLELVNLADHKEKFPSDISGGMKKRAGLARAIVREPEIVLYDEPTSGLDPIMSRQIDVLINKLQDELGVTSVVVTHDMESSYLCTEGGRGRIAMLHQGLLRAVGTPDEIRVSEDPIVAAFVRGGYMEDADESILDPTLQADESRVQAAS